MRGTPSGEVFRALTPYTVGLWIGGFGWLLLVMMSLGRFYEGRAILAILPIVLFTIALALALQALFVMSRTWRQRMRVPVVVVAAILAAMLTSYVDLALDHLMAVTFFPQMLDWAQVDLEGWSRGAFIYGWVFGFNVVLMMLRLAIEQARSYALELRQALDEAQTARLTMLRYQLNPHFMFNSLNALSSLVLTRRNDRAEQMIERLCAFLRSSASSDPASLVPLNEELATIAEYLEVESVRFDDRLAVDYRITPEAGNMLVPSFLLQPIIENAIKYGVAPATRRVCILISARVAERRVMLEVSDDGGTDVPAKSGSGIGLANVRERLAAFFGEDATFEAGRVDGGYRARIELPARRQA